MFASATAYYLVCVARNRVRAGAKKLKQPKYLFGILFVGFYFWGILFANPSFDTDADGETQRQNATWMLGTMGLLQTALAWFVASRGFGFRESDVQQLFPRPFTRFQLLLFKWFANLFGTLLMSLLVGLFLRRYDGLSYPNVVVGFTLFQMTLATHVTLCGLIHAHITYRGGLGAQLRFVPAWLLAVAIPVSVALAWRDVGGVNGWEDARALAQAPPLSWLLTPFTLAAAPLATVGVADLARASIAPLAIIAVHLFLMRSVRFEFADRAIELAGKIQRVRSEGLSAFRSKKELMAKPTSPWQLAPTGAAWKALVWKNVVSLSRLPRRTIVRVVVMVVLVAAVLSAMADEGAEAHLPTRVGFVLMALVFYLTLLGPALVRVDLRIDIPHFDVLKSMPLRGRELIFGEVMGSVVVLWAIQVVAALVATVLIREESGTVFAWSDKLPVLVGALVAFFAIDFTLLTAENLLALWLPGFVRLGRGLKMGLDQMGLNFLGALVRILVLLVLFVVPAAGGAGIGVLLTFLELPLAAALGSGLLVGGVLLLLESWLLILFSEGRYERFDITSENVGAEG